MRRIGIRVTITRRSKRRIRINRRKTITVLESKQKKMNTNNKKEIHTYEGVGITALSLPHCRDRNVECVVCDSTWEYTG